MPLRRSSFVHLLPLDGGVVLAVHAITQARVTITPDVARMIAWFDAPVEIEAALPALQAILPAGADAIRGCLSTLTQCGLLTEQAEAEEIAKVTGELSPTYGRDPAALLDRYRRANMDGAHPYWTVEAPYALSDTAAPRRAGSAPARRLDVLVLGECEAHMETGFLRQEASRRGIDLHIAASFPSDTDLPADRKHDAIVIGALRSRHAVVLGEAEDHGGDPARVYADDMRALIAKLRAHSSAPILIDGLPEPTVQPMGFADRGIHGHRNRFRRVNLALADMAEAETDVHVVDVAAALNAAGSANLLDDGLMSFTHFGAPGWLLQRPEAERAAVHGLFPDLQPLADRLGGDPYGREAVVARAHMDAIVTVLRLDQKKCVIVDLDGVLWPGVLAETGSPFAWTPEIGGQHAFAGVFFGIHEALRTLRRRGILLACVSKNDEATVRSLWTYGPDYPSHRLLTPAHFVTTRINWRDKAENIQSIADELGFPLEAFVFVDDTPRERERILTGLPGVTVLGEDLLSLRRTLLTDPRLQSPYRTREAENRSRLVETGIEREKLRREAPDHAAFIQSLSVVASVERVGADALDGVADRICELVSRTTQFNATGRRFTAGDLRRIVGAPDGRIYVLHMRDRLGDHGLVGVAVVLGEEILNLVMSCRVIGLGGETALLDAVVGEGRRLRGRIVPTDRNLPVRHVYARHGFREGDGGEWVMGEAPMHRNALETAQA
jgi:FkbH-like protein